VDVAECELELLAAADVMKLEADCFWCFSKLLDGIQDNYTFAQPGIQKRVNSLKELVSRIDSKQCLLFLLFLHFGHVAYRVRQNKVAP